MSTPNLNPEPSEIVCPSEQQIAAVAQSAGRADLPSQMPSALNQLKEHFDNWYFGFEWQAMELCLCAVLAHYLARSTQALWPFIVGAGRTGKTEAVTSFRKLPQAHTCGDLSPKALMSGWQSKGLLKYLNDTKKTILIFKDFTTMLSKNHNDAREVLAMFREIADGDFDRWTGQGEVPHWEGKLTILGAVTDAIDDYYSIMNILGPRFLFYRWPTPDAEKVSQAAKQQITREDHIHLTAQQLIGQIVAGGQALKLADIPAELDRTLDHYCAMFVRLRQGVKWQGNEIIKSYEVEGAGAIAKHLQLIARARATLYGRTMVIPEDIALARRIAQDSVPQARLKVLRAIIQNPGKTAQELARITGWGRQTVRRAKMELVEIGLVVEDDSYNATANLGDISTLLLETE